MRFHRLASGAVLATLPALGCVPGLTSTSSAAERPATVYVIQALAQGTVSLRVDDQARTYSLQPRAVLDALRLSAGHHVLIFSGSSPDWTLRATVVATGGKSSDVVLHRPADVAGDPVVTTYDNDLAPIANGKGRVVVAHTAVVPPADVLVDGNVVFADIANGEFASADVPAGDLKVAIVPTGESAPVLLGPLDLEVLPRVLTRVFAVGEPTNGSMDVIVQHLKLVTSGSPPPSSVPLGSGGLVSQWSVATTTASPPEPSTGAGTVVLAALLVVGAAALMLVGRLRGPAPVHRRSKRRDDIATG